MPTLTDDKVWEQFLAWLPSAKPSTDPGTLFGQYRSRLMALGLMAGEVDEYLAVVANNMRTRSDGWRVMFNNIYASGTAGFSTAPNALLMATVEGVSRVVRSMWAWVKAETPCSWHSRAGTSPVSKFPMKA